MPHRNGIASDRRQDVVLLNQPMAHEVSDAIVVAAHAMKRTFGALSSTERAKLLPGRAREHVQQEKLIVLKLRALPNLEQMRRDGKVTFTRRLAQLQNHYDCTCNECDGRDDGRNRSRNFPVNRGHPVETLSTRKI